MEPGGLPEASGTCPGASRAEKKWFGEPRVPPGRPGEVILALLGAPGARFWLHFAGFVLGLLSDLFFLAF